MNNCYPQNQMRKRVFLNVFIFFFVFIGYAGKISLNNEVGSVIQPSEGPIIVLTSSTNPFSSYTGEILLAEGLNEFSTSDISAVSSEILNNYEVIILGEIPVTVAQVTLLTEFVNSGGTLIAFKPDSSLAPLMGLQPAGGTLSDSYLLIDTSSEPGKGLVNETIQFHSEADLYTLSGANSLATLYSSDNTSTSYPAVSINTVGDNGGVAVAFTFDLARSIVYTRQGNPALAGNDNDNISPIRSNDMFYPDYVNLSKVQIPQADEQQRLLANIILQNSKIPVPRFWYLPRGLKAAVVMTGDDHGNGGTNERFEQYLSLSSDNSPEAVAEWRAIRGTSYIYPSTPITDSEAKYYEDRGFEIALHLTTNCGDYTPLSIENFFTSQLSEFNYRFPSLLAPATNRTHCIAFSDWASQPKVEAAKGIRLDANYYYWPGSWVQNRPGLFTGSGFPMRFADLDGTVIETYQLATQMTDESEQTFPYTIDRLLDNAIGPKGFYGVFCANMHTDNGSSPGSDAIINSALTRGVPVISAKQILTWLDARNGSSFSNFVWAGNSLSFEAAVAPNAVNLEAMLPLYHDDMQLVSLQVNGSPLNFRTEKIKGIDYVIFSAQTGTFTANYEINSPPIVSISTPQNNEVFTAGENIDITVMASDPDADGTISKVEFLEGSTVLGEDLDGTDGWSFTWPAVKAGNYSLTAKATDNKGAIAISEPVAITVDAACPCTVFEPSDVPAGSYNDGRAIQLGMKFSSSVDGFVNGIKFYKPTSDAGTHVGQLYSSTGELLAQVNFENETASGWQEASFNSPIAITAETTYVISYHSSSGEYNATVPGFSQAIVNGPLRGLAYGENGPNGVYLYSATPSYPTNAGTTSANYYVDVIFDTQPSTVNVAPNISLGSPTEGSEFTAPATIDLAATASDGDGEVVKVEFFHNNTLLGADSNGSDGWTFTWSPVGSGNYSLTAKATDNNGAFTISDPVSITVNQICPCTVFEENEFAGNSYSHTGGIQLGMRFSSEKDGYVTGVRFYKADGDASSHIGQLYDNTGNLLAEGSFINETSSGWQEVLFDQAVQIVKDQTYVISYHKGEGIYVATNDYFVQPKFNPPLKGLSNGEDGLNGVYLESGNPAFPTKNFKASNYWVDVVFETEILTENPAPQISFSQPTEGDSFTAPATIDIVANVSDNGEVVKVEFFNGNTKLGEDTDGTNGWTYTWTSVMAGTYKLTAKATDNEGSTSETSINITVSPDLSVQRSIVEENALPGNPSGEWQISGAGDLSLQGFATDMSYNKGETARFKIKTDANDYSIKIYRLGYYQGHGARYQGDATITTTLPQNQPLCLEDPETGLVDCGNWAESATWQIPANAVSGIYLALLTRKDTGGSSHIVFVVRDDASNSDLLFQTSDATWQAYNVYGDDNNGRSLYTGAGGKATKVSYNRPFVTRNGGGGGGAEEDWLFNAEYPMLRWLEANGFDVTYTTNVDSDRRGELIKNHKIFLSVGHDEYWSGNHRQFVEQARDQGTSLAFFSGNEVYWKTRWENSIDGNGISHRTLVCYKEGSEGENVCSGKCDPSAEWTGLWRGGCELASDACQPENALTGQISWAESDAAISVPAAFKDLRFWRNTSVASLGADQTATFTYGTIGYEWNPEQEAYKSSYPDGRILMSKTEVNGDIHNISLYKHSSGALVFGAGTVQWSWGLDGNHDRGNAAPSKDMQQATINLLADMGAQPGSLQPDLIQASPSTDAEAPVVTFSSPSEDAIVTSNSAVVIAGTAEEENVLVAVEISVDGGLTWEKAEGASNWNYTWTPTIAGATTILARAFDDSGNLGSPISLNVTVETGTVECPCTVFEPTDVPATGLSNDDKGGIQAGMKFKSSVDGFVTGVKFYKPVGDLGTHIGQLYSSTQELLATVNFENETASGWQEAIFSTPVSITSGTTYLISYHSSTGDYNATPSGFSEAILNYPLRGLANGEDGPNGVFLYSSTPAFPTSTWEGGNYWVDVIFDTDVNAAPTVAITSPSEGGTFTAPADIVITADVSDTDGSVTSVEFFEGENSLGVDSDGTDGWSMTWKEVAANSYILTAVATDDDSEATTSEAVNIVVEVPNVAPSVAITSPSDNATFIAPAEITVTAAASDEDGNVSSVEIYNGETKLGSAVFETDSWTYTWTDIPAGHYSLTAVATDDDSEATTSAAVNIVVEAPNVAPVVAITSPSEAAVFTASDDIPVVVTATDTDGSVNSVEIFSGETKLGDAVLDIDSWKYTWTTVPAGNYSLTAVATDDDSKTTTSAAVNIVVEAPNVAPVVAITSPSEAAVFTASDDIPVVVTATDTDGSVNSVEIFSGETKLGDAVLDIDSWKYTWTTVPAGNYSLTAVATDDDSKTTTSEAVNIVVEVPNVAPGVAITSPSEGATYSAPADIVIAADATDTDGSVTSVEFFEGVNSLGIDNDGTDGWSVNWSGVAADNYTLTAVATDDEGSENSSAAINFQVVNLPSITNFIPSSGPVGSLVMINGIHLEEVNEVSFGPVSAEIISTSETKIEVRVPEVKGKLPKDVKIALVSPAGSYTSSNKFQVTAGTAPVNEVPLVDIVSPANNTTYTSPAVVELLVKAIDPDGIVTKVEFFQGNIKLGEDLSSPYEFTWTNVPSGPYTLTAIATDDKGGRGSSEIVNIVVSDPGGNLAPKVYITTPLNNQSFTAPSEVTIAAEAVDPDGSIASVEFYSGTLSLGKDELEPYEYTWSNVPSGKYYLTAIAKDNEGAITTSEVIVINVSAALTIAAPTNLTAAWISESDVLLSWNDNHTGEDGFIIERSFKSDFTGKIDYISVSADETSYVDKNLNRKKGGGVLYYRIKAVKDNVSSNFSNVASTSTVSGTIAGSYNLTSPILNIVEESFIVYPNPTSGYATIQFALAQTSSFQLNLYDSKGIFLSSIKDGEAEAGILYKVPLDVGNLSQGIYVLLLKTGLTQNSYTLVIQR